jgi:hypothetical protein
LLFSIINASPSLCADDTKHKTNGAESFHAHYNELFYAAHPTIFIFLDVIWPCTPVLKIRKYWWADC